MSSHKPPSDEVLSRHLRVLEQCGDNESEAAKALGVARTTFQGRIALARRRGLDVARPGRLDVEGVEEKSLPTEGVKRYVITAAQNDTAVNPHWTNLLAFSQYLNQHGDTCELIVGTYTYEVGCYGEGAVKRDTAKTHARNTYALCLRPYLLDEVVQLAPGLVYAGNFNALPTAVSPLSALDRFGGRNSIIIPHAKQHMTSVASMPTEGTKLLFSTGTVTQRNYIQKRAGIQAEPEHCYGALLVEVRADGSWFVRQLVIGERGEVYDIGPEWADGCVCVVEGQVLDGQRAEAINWGDIHSFEMPPWVRELAWGEGGMLDSLSPRLQFAEDVHSQHSRNHHDAGRFERNFLKWARGEESVSDELDVTADVLRGMARPWVTTVVKRANHHEHLHRWLDEADYREDPVNAEFYLEAQLARVRALKRGDLGFQVLEWAMRRREVSGDVRFLGRDESFVVCPDVGGGIECSLHGHRGVDGARGSTRGLRALARRVNKGHDHRAFLDQFGVGSTGSCALEFDYSAGPTTHTFSHIVTYPNSARSIITMWGGRYRA